MNRPPIISSVDKALLALQRLGEAGGEGVTLNRLAIDLGLNKSSLHHTLSVLRYRGFAEQDSSGHYKLGKAALTLADSFINNRSNGGEGRVEK
jgi:IclR family acetate operon transcriptional repressor